MVIISVILLVSAGYFSPIFHIKNIEVIQNRQCINNEEILEDKAIVGEKIFKINSVAVTKSLSQKYPCIKSIVVKKIFPNKLKIEVQVSEAVTKIENTNFSLTDEGLVVESQATQSMPTLYIPPDSSLKLGQKIDDESVLFAAKLASFLNKSDYLATRIRVIDSNNIVAYSQNDLVVLFSTKKSAQLQVDSLQLVLSKAKIDGTKIAKIDLRFDKPIIVH